MPYPLWAVAVDINGDGKLDLATANLGAPAGVSLLLGNGDGTFRPATFYPVGGNDRFLAAGDFNGDHQPDLVVADALSGAAIILLNTGVVSFSPTSPVNFPSQLLHTSSAPQTVTLTNTGLTPLTIASISVGGPFHARNTCGGSVSAGASCTISAIFEPTAEGNASGIGSIHDSASSKPQVIDLTGAGTVVALTPRQLKFPGQKVGTTSAPLQMKVTNTGSTLLTFTNIYLDGSDYKDFSQTNNCGSQIAAGASCTVTVTFTPKKTGARSAYVGLSDSGGGSPQTVNLTGTGV